MKKLQHKPLKKLNIQYILLAKICVTYYIHYYL